MRESLAASFTPPAHSLLFLSLSDEPHHAPPEHCHFHCVIHFTPSLPFIIYTSYPFIRWSFSLAWPQPEGLILLHCRNVRQLLVRAPSASLLLPASSTLVLSAHHSSLGHSPHSACQMPTACLLILINSLATLHVRHFSILSSPHIELVLSRLPPPAITCFLSSARASSGCPAQI